MAVAVKEKPKEKVWTYEDYFRLEDDKRYELIDGRLEEMPAPSFEHQEVLNTLNVLLYLFVRDKDMGKVLPAPFDVILSETVVVQPDILFLSTEALKNVKHGRLFGPPDLVVEVVSPTSYVRDRYEKFALYERHGVKEYWLVYPGLKVIEVWCLRDSKYVLHSVAVEKGEVESCILSGFKVKVEEVMR